MEFQIKLNEKDEEFFKEFNDSYIEIAGQLKIPDYVFDDDKKIELIEADPDDISNLIELVALQSYCSKNEASEKLRECNYDLVKTLISL